MAIVEMLKLKLYGASADKQKILDALFETQLVTLKGVDEIDGTNVLFDDEAYTQLENKRAKLERAINIIETNIELFSEKKKENSDEFVALTTDEFERIILEKDSVDKTLQDLDNLLNVLNDIKKDRTNLENKITQLTPFLCVKENFSDFKQTKNTNLMLGILSQNALKEWDNFLKDCPLTTYEVEGPEGNIIKVYSHNSESFLVTKKLNELGFIKANFDIDANADTTINVLKTKINGLSLKEKEVSVSLCSFKDKLKMLKTMHDYIRFLMAKEDAENKFRCTPQAFVLEGYLAKESQEKVYKKLRQTSDSIEYEFSVPDKNEIPPTITKNNKVVSQFEFVTNMYSPPHYRELDPNTFIAIFFSIFFGFVMADMGYGILLVVLGIVLAMKKKNNKGMRQLMLVLSIGGVFSIIFGFLFGSFFGLTNAELSIIPTAVMPDPMDDATDLLMVCLAMGVVHIMASYILKGILLVKRKRILEAVSCAFCWDFFFVGLSFVVLDMLSIIKGLFLVGSIIAGISVAVSVIGQFFINSGFEKVSKSFGAVYGIINLFSDILSYARLFGLMLSGAIIGSIVNTLASGFLTSPVTFIAGVLILLIGHTFNFAMGALGAYIHVARLQYIEFFSKFYEGEGELFVPFGTNFSYIKLI